MCGHLKRESARTDTGNMQSGDFERWHNKKIAKNKIPKFQMLLKWPSKIRKTHRDFHKISSPYIFLLLHFFITCNSNAFNGYISNGTGNIFIKTNPVVIRFNIPVQNTRITHLTLCKRGSQTGCFDEDKTLRRWRYTHSRLLFGD